MSNDMNENKWGVLYCPKSGILTTPKKRWERIERCLKAEGIDYDYVQSENSGSVDRLVKMLISNGYKTIVIVGGDSALNDAVNCLMQIDSQKRDEIALGVIPNGMMNDFAHFWDLKEDDLEQTVKWLKQRRIRKIGADSRFDHAAGLIRRLLRFRHVHVGSKRHPIHGHSANRLCLQQLRRRCRHGHLSPCHLRHHRLRRTCARIHHHAAIKIGRRRERHVFHVGQILAEHADLPHEDIAWFHQLMHRPAVEQTALQMMMATPLPEELADVANVRSA